MKRNQSDNLKQHIEKLTESLEFAEALIRTTREPLIALDGNLRVVMANRSFYRVFKVSKTDTEHKCIYELGNKQWNIPELRKLLEDILPRNSYFNDYEVEHTFPSIGKKVMLLNARKFNLGGEYILLAIEDITVRKKVEKEKDEFASLISHELKNPVATINGYAQILEGYFKKHKDNKPLRYIDSINEQIHRLTNLINGLLNAGRIRARGFTFSEQNFDFDDLVDETVEDIQHTTSTHKIIKRGESGIEVCADIDRIREVLINLILNALKYSPNADKVIVKVSADKKQITLGVQDFGIGISKKQQERVFERFFQIDGSQTEAFYGIGLGLDISAQIIRHYGGKIWVESGRSKGSTFYFTLPIKYGSNPSI